jgi:hypothetical protein
MGSSEKYATQVIPKGIAPGGINEPGQTMIQPTRPRHYIISRTSIITSPTIERNQTIVRMTGMPAA